MVVERLKQMLDVFSRRRREGGYPPDTVPETLRNKTILLCRDVFGGNWRDEFVQSGDYTGEFWEDIHRALQYIHGKPRLWSQPTKTLAEDAVLFLLNCQPKEFLDFVELIFRVECLFRVVRDRDDLVDAVNELLKSEGAPYQVTHFVTNEEDYTGPRPFPFGGKVIRTVAYPKVVRVDEEVTFTHAVVPALTALSDPAYNSANLEFRGALEDYRKGDYGDCLTKCGSAFESVMKVICQKKNWPYKPTDPASPLLKTILSKTSLDSFFEQPLILITTLRNRLSTAHGAGTGTRTVERHVAEYAVASTAAAVVLLIHETR